jgi:uncharacterized damage-inducible protein DinB
VNEALVELFRHKTWATVSLIEACEQLTAEQLAASAPGTYGSIRDTLLHLVASDESYLSTATGQPVHEPITESASLHLLADRVRQTGQRWELVAADPGAASRQIVTSDGWRTPASVPIAQAIQHADEHRGHVLTVLGANGIELPGIDIGEDLDVWHHGIATGLMRQAP